MKNKKFIALWLAIVLTLAVITFAGCEKEIREYNINDVGIVTISDAIEEYALPSCVVLSVEVKGTLSETKFSHQFIGLAVTETKVIIPGSAFPNPLLYSNIVYKGKIISSEQNLEFVLKAQDNRDSINMGFYVLTIVGDTKLTPVKFADSDNLELMQSLFGVEYSEPYVIGLQSSDAIDFMRVNSVMVSSKSMMYGNKRPQGMDNLVSETFTTSGYFVVSNPGYIQTFIIKVDGVESKNYSHTSNFLFNTSGEFVGLNYMKKVDDTTLNEEVVDGIGYACRSNAIKDSLERRNIFIGGEQ